MPHQSVEHRLRRDERGASLVEYALLLALIAVVCIAAVSMFGSNLNHSYSKDASAVAATP
jgi:pilus assembly protein Flp/PilA